MAEDIVTIVNEIANKEGMSNGIQFHNIHHKSTLSILYTNEIGYDNDSDIFCACLFLKKFVEHLESCKFQRNSYKFFFLKL